MHESEWKRSLEGLNTPFSELITDHKQAKEVIKKALFQAINEQAPIAQGVAFSGGVDSSFLLMHSRVANPDIIPISVGTKDSQDLLFATEFTQKFIFEHITKILTEKEAEQLIRKVIEILPKRDAVSVGVGAVTLQVCQLAKESGMKTVMTGLGSEELFAGYARHDDAYAKGGWEGLHQECWKGLQGLYERDLERDQPLARTCGITLSAPFLDANVIKAAMSVHPQFKLNSEHKKVILREIAQENGVEPKWAWRAKKAAQYGSAFHKVLEKMAKKEHKTIQEFLA